jgi:heterodisulfide reductase subunit C
MLLTWWFAVSLIGRFFFLRRRRARQNILARYSPDGIYALPEAERAAFPSYQKCLACSLCTFSCQAIASGRAPASFEPKYLFFAYGRSSADSEVFREQWLPCTECSACTVECPNGAPIHAMAQQIIDRRKRVGFRR